MSPPNPNPPPYPQTLPAPPPPSQEYKPVMSYDSQRLRLQLGLRGRPLGPL